MAYLGNPPAEAYTNTVKDSFNGDGSTTAFTLSQPSTTNNLRVVVENVIQDPTVAYSCSGTTLTFTSAPPSGTANIYAVHLGPATMTAVPPTEITNATTYTSNLTVQGDLTVDTNTLYVDSTNNRVGVGTASPSVNAEIRGSASNGQIRLGGSTAGTYGNFYSDNDGVLVLGADAGNNAASSYLGFEVDATERARIQDNGNCYFGRATYSVWTEGFGVESVGSGSSGTYLNTAHKSGTTSGRPYHYFFYNNGVIGSINQSGTTGVTYNTTSDYRLKENVADLTGAIDRVKQVPVHRFNFIADPDKTVDGFLAHEVQSIVPEAITGEKDAVRTEEYEVTSAVLDDDGNVVTEAVMGTREVPEYQGIDQSKLVPLLTAAIKEQQAMIEDLQTRLAALETP